MATSPQFTSGVSTCGSISLMLASMRAPHAAKHQYNPHIAAARVRIYNP